MSLNRNRKIGMGLQQLEDRRLMAGDVAVYLDSGDLKIIGDAGHNRVDITTINGQIRVTGTQYLGNTTINGQNIPFLINANLVDDLIVDMNGGNDRVMVNQLHLNATSHADLVIDTDDGDDLVGIYNSSARDLDVDTHGHNDDVIVSGSHFSRDLKVELGSGDDELDLYSAQAGRHIKADGETGHDDVAIQFSVAADELYVRLGSGNDVAWINGGEFDELALYGDGDNDRITVQYAEVNSSSYIDMGSGNDQLYLNHNDFFGSKQFRGGTGSDTLQGVGNNFNPFDFDSSF